LLSAVLAIAIEVAAPIAGWLLDRVWPRCR